MLAQLACEAPTLFVPVFEVGFCCIRLRPARRNHVWSWDFVMDRTDDGRPIRILTLIDEFTRECLASI